jgi:hypothetical protein
LERKRKMRHGKRKIAVLDKVKIRDEKRIRM